MADRNTTTDKPSQDPGTRKGENRARPLLRRRTRTASDASSINLENRAPIDPRMPHLPPA